MPPERTALIAVSNVSWPARPCFGFPSGTFKHDIGTDRPGQFEDGRQDVARLCIQRVVGSQLAQTWQASSRTSTVMIRPAAADPQSAAFQPHAPLAEDHDRITDLDLGRLHRRHTIAQ